MLFEGFPKLLDETQRLEDPESEKRCEACFTGC